MIVLHVVEAVVYQYKAKGSRHTTWIRALGIQSARAVIQALSDIAYLAPPANMAAEART